MTLTDLLKQESIRRLEEGLGRIHKCIGMMADDHVWHRPSGNVVSVGNLILHLAGNVGQWINATLGGEDDQRMRDAEFQEKGPLDRVQLMELIDRTVQRATMTMDGLDQEALEKRYAVQCYEETGIAILVHVVEHFSYHVGQITLHTKLLMDTDTGYYSGQDLGMRKE